VDVGLVVPLAPGTGPGDAASLKVLADSKVSIAANASFTGRAAGTIGPLTVSAGDPGGDPAKQAKLRADLSLELSDAGAAANTPVSFSTFLSGLDVNFNASNTPVGCGEGLSTPLMVCGVIPLYATVSGGPTTSLGTVALRLADGVPAGKLQLTLPTARGNYLVHVYEPSSTLLLTLGAERDSVVGGESLRIHASIAGATLERIGGLISAPDGASQYLTFARQPDGGYLANVTPDVAHAGDPGLWEVHAFALAAGKLAIPRDARTAFAVSVPVARLDGTVTRADAAGKRELALRIGVETAMASRYQASAVLYGTGADGQLHPAAIAQSAAWLERGKGSLELRYDAASLATALGSPWELRDLRLGNQADMGVLERRERALVLP
jgi:hypothetical protein